MHEAHAAETDGAQRLRHRADKKIKLPVYPMTTGRTSTRFLRVIDSLQLTQAQVATR